MAKKKKPKTFAGKVEKWGKRKMKVKKILPKKFKKALGKRMVIKLGKE